MEKESIVSRLVEVCREVLDSIVLDPSIEITDVDVQTIRCSRFGSETPTLSYLITVSTNDATMVRGAIPRYKGSYKERIEAVLNKTVKEIDPDAQAFVNIVGPETQSVDRLLPIHTLIETGKLSPNAPIVTMAAHYCIDYIQIRGRHLIAPSPAIAEFLERYAAQHLGSIRRAVDLFAGTAIATKVLLRAARPEKVVIVENDPLKISRVHQNINDDRVEILQVDALSFSFVDKYDLAIADPYYEDVELFLSKQLDNIRRNVRVLILVPGNVEDRIWNTAVRSKLESLDYSVLAHEFYGQVIFEATLPHKP